MSDILTASVTEVLQTTALEYNLLEIATESVVIEVAAQETSVIGVSPQESVVIETGTTEVVVVDAGTPTAEILEACIQGPTGPQGEQGPPGPVGPVAPISTDPENQLTLGTDSGLYVARFVGLPPDYIPPNTILVIPARHQMPVCGAIEIDGTLDILGKLVLT